jgi:hypothetical protein
VICVLIYTFCGLCSHIDILWFVFSYRHFVVCVPIYRHFVLCVLLQTYCGLCSHIDILWFAFTYTDVFRNTLLAQTVCHKKIIRQTISFSLQHPTAVYPRTHQLIRQMNTTQAFRRPRQCTEVPFVKRKLSCALQTSANNSRCPTDTLEPTEISTAKLNSHY